MERSEQYGALFVLIVYVGMFILAFIQWEPPLQGKFMFLILLAYVIYTIYLDLKENSLEV